ncbi:MAG: hypothetical protein KGS61_21790 [Verrucomicrobia bacterium]|nr:hypothetical protein [Verrucomicrobiota bacterium]
MKSWLVALAVCLTLAVLALTLIVVVQAYDHRLVSSEKAALERDLRSASLRISDLQQEQAAVVKDLQTRSTEVQDLTAKLADATEASTNPPVGSTLPPRPYQAPAYLGNQYLGLAWVVPRNIVRNPRTGRFTFEPALVLDPGLKQVLATSAADPDTRSADQPPPTSPTPPNYSVYNSYYNAWPWVAWTPGGSATTPDRPSRVPPTPAPNPPPRSPTVTSPWTPITSPMRPWSPGPSRVRPPDSSSGFAPAANQAAQMPAVRTAAVQ